MDQLQDRGWEVQLRWILAHLGVPGNEAADKAAKEVAGNDPNLPITRETPPEPGTLRTLSATTKSNIRQAMKVEWDQN